MNSSVTMSQLRQAQKEAYKKGRTDGICVMVMGFALELFDHFGFSHDQFKNLIDDVFKLSDEVSSGELDYTEIVKTLKDEFDVEIDFRNGDIKT